MGGAVITKVTEHGLLTAHVEGQYIVHYTNNTCLVWDAEIQAHKYPQQYIRVDAVDELDAAVKGMARLKVLYGANNVSFGSNEDEFGSDAQEQATKE